MLLHCCKTGREWIVDNVNQAYRLAMKLGLKDWITTPDKH